MLGMQAAADNACVDVGGSCTLARDGFYLLSYTMVACGIAMGVWYMRLLPRLETLPLSSWRASKARKR